MALLKSINTNFGTPATYWKIVDLNVNWLTKNVHVVMCGWKDQQARTDGKSPLDQRSYDWSGDTFPFTDEEPQNEREISYTKIKSIVIPATDTQPETDGEFSDATDA